MFKRTIKEAFKWSMKWYFGSFGSSIAIFFFMNKYFEFPYLRSVKYGVTLLVFSFLVKVVFQYLKEIDILEKTLKESQNKVELLDNKQNKKKLITRYSHYGETLILLGDTFSYINELKRKKSISEKELTKVLIQVCNKLKYIFEKRLNSIYSVSIKVSLDKKVLSSDVEVTTICRDEDSYLNRTNSKKISHKIIDNTCFNEILYNIDMPNKAFYFNNNLPNDKYYKNSSFNNYGSIPENATNSDRIRLWTLPYKSEIVVPITPTLHSENDRKRIFYGYLCIDCSEIDGFHKKYDIKMIKGISDGLSDLFKNWELN